MGTPPSSSFSSFCEKRTKIMMDLKIYTYKCCGYKKNIFEEEKKEEFDVISDVFVPYGREKSCFSKSAPSLYHTALVSFSLMKKKLAFYYLKKKTYFM